MDKKLVKQMILPLCDGNAEVFFEAGFFEDISVVSPIHDHKYCEVHFTERGKSTLVVNKMEYTISAGEILIIPAGMTHTSHNANETRHRAFQVNYPVSQIKKCSFPPEIFTELIRKIDDFLVDGKPRDISKYIIFMCKDIFTAEPKISDAEDRGFIINDFFANNYHLQIRIDDLAGRLNLSPKQTQRLVESYTSNTFGKELTKVRIEAARRIIKENKELSLLEISQRVGYRSYSGFWKAFKTVK